MFYCNKCAKDNRWPKTVFKSYGLCELCLKYSACTEQPSRELPIPKKEGSKNETI
jgi:hypothetical protein